MDLTNNSEARGILCTVPCNPASAHESAIDGDVASAYRLSKVSKDGHKPTRATAAEGAPLVMDSNRSTRRSNARKPNASGSTGGTGWVVGPASHYYIHICTGGRLFVEFVWKQGW
jgi:hypothetical protein